MPNQWLLIETFGSDQPPSIIGAGSTRKNMVPLPTFLGRGSNLQAVEAAVAHVLATGQRDDFLTRDQQRRAVAEPLFSFRGDIHGVWAWVGRAGEEPPPRDLAGAWYFNCTTDAIGGSDDLLDLYGVAPMDRQTQRSTAEAFGRLIPNSDQQDALAMLVRSQPGEEHQSVWAIRRDDGEMRAGHLSFRAVAEINNGQPEVVLRGITHDIGPAAATPAAPPPAVLEQRVLESMARPGEHRAIVNLKTLRIIRWLDAEPLPRLRWKLDPAAPDQRWIHPDDQHAAKSLTAQLRTGPTSGVLRLAAEGGGWLDVAILANIMLLDTHTTAGLFTMKLAKAASTH